MAKTFRRNDDDFGQKFVSKKKERRNRQLANLSKSGKGYMAIANYIAGDIPSDEDYDDE